VSTHSSPEHSTSLRTSKDFVITDGADDLQYTVTVKVGSKTTALRILQDAERAIERGKSAMKRQELPGQLRMPV
jgi:hypothetical protein